VKKSKVSVKKRASTKKRSGNKLEPSDTATNDSKKQKVSPWNALKKNGKLRAAVVVGGEPTLNSVESQEKPVGPNATSHPARGTSASDSPARSNWAKNINIINAVKAFAEPTQQYQLGGERLKSVCTVVPSRPIPSTIPLDDTNKLVCTIGRQHANDVCLNSLRYKDVISRRHAKIVHDPVAHTWTLTDLGSLNGTFVNNIRVSNRVLQFGDELVFGGPPGTKLGDIRPQPESEFRFRFEKYTADGNTEEAKEEEVGLRTVLDTLKEVQEYGSIIVGLVVAPFFIREYLSVLDPLVAWLGLDADNTLHAGAVLIGAIVMFLILLWSVVTAWKKCSA